MLLKGREGQLWFITNHKQLNGWIIVHHSSMLYQSSKIYKTFYSKVAQFN